jgi:DUF2919 family protein
MCGGRDEGGREPIRASSCEMGVSFNSPTLRVPGSGSRSRMRRAYPPSSYDDFMCLKPPLLLWIAVVYLSRAVTLPIVLGFSSMSGGSRDISAFVGGFIGVENLLPSLIAALVLFAFMRRAPSGSRAIRWIWARGRILLAISAGADVFFLAAGVASHGERPGDQAGSLILAASLDLYFLAYVLTARRVRDTFSDFPAAVDSAQR